MIESSLDMMYAMEFGFGGLTFYPLFICAEDNVATTF